uniref:EGF-like domain-containing protein n=2 Tax=Macrostomum lignano TaxID=282301 RepID=A0A1I8G4X7_9PLAT
MKAFWSLFNQACRLLLLLHITSYSLARNFKYASQLREDEYRHFKYGFTSGTLGTLFMHYPAQVFSCDYAVSYRRFGLFEERLDVADPMDDTLKTASQMGYFDSVARQLFDTWSSCYQNFITRYCMYMVTTKDRMFINRVRMCKHMYFPKTPENLRKVTYLLREVKPYINFHMYEHIALNEHADTFSASNLYPLGLEYLFDWNYLGYGYTPEIAYSNIKAMGIYGLQVYFDRTLGPKSFKYARFTLLADSWIMKFIQIVHEILWSSVNNYRGHLSHELINAYRNFEHVQLQYLTHMCTKWLNSDRKNSPSSEADDIFDISMCPNPCLQSDICDNKPHTSGKDCTPVGLGKTDYRCECMAGYVWNPLSLSCDESFDCNVDCEPTSTRYCSFVPAVELSIKDVGHDRLISREGHLRCDCYPEFEGDRCQRYRNPCNTGADGKMSGNEMCRVDYGGTCSASAGFNHYICKCPKGYQRKKALREDNCLDKRSACDSIICANNGVCHSSLDGEKFECVCTPGFEGRLCEEPIVYQWTYWSDWSSCDSLCGQGWQVSHRVCWNRQRGGQDAKQRCPGNRETLRVCHKHCLTEIQASHYIAIGLLLELLFRMSIVILLCFLFVKVLFDMLYRESDYVFVRYLRIVLLDLVKRAVGARQNS